MSHLARLFIYQAMTAFLLPCAIEPCPACVRQENEVARGLEVLLAYLEEFAAPLQRAGGLCLPHFVQAARAANRAERELLLAIEQGVWAELSEDLEDFIRKQMEHHHGEPITDQARLAVEQTISALTGEYPAR
jgi:hypothetical protein